MVHTELCTSPAERDKSRGRRFLWVIRGSVLNREPMAIGAKNNQIPFALADQVAPGRDVMDLQIPASPEDWQRLHPITAQDFLMQLLRRLGHLSCRWFRRAFQRAPATLIPRTSPFRRNSTERRYRCAPHCYSRHLARGPETFFMGRFNLAQSAAITQALTVEGLAGFVGKC